MAVHKKFNNGIRNNALGRGLDALISTEGVRTQGSSTINEIPLDQIEANPNQPRREFDEEALRELADSISAIGIIQPITLRQISENRFPSLSTSSLKPRRASFSATASGSLRSRLGSSMLILCLSN